MTTRFTTKSGGIYEVDFESNRYRKVKTTDESLVYEFPWDKFISLRSRGDQGSDFEDDDRIRVGRQYYFSNFDAWNVTSPVVSIEEIA